MKPKALILLAYGTNRDQDVSEALALSGAEPEIVPLNALRSGAKAWSDFQMLILPGGFSYADALGAGKLLAVDMQTYFADEVRQFVETGKPVLGICNGFQTLVKAGILPEGQGSGDQGQGAKKSQAVLSTLTFNAGGHFECRWVTLKPISQTCLWTKGLSELIECPVAHGEGNFQTTGAFPADQIALVYVDDTGKAAGGAYPVNPNGSMLDIAGVTNSQGNVLGLMPHPENHIYPWQHPQWTRGVERGSGLALFRNGVHYAEER